MSGIKYMAKALVIKKAMKALIRELGPVEAVRFIAMPRKMRLESVKRHRKW